VHRLPVAGFVEAAGVAIGAAALVPTSAAPTFAAGAVAAFGVRPGVAVHAWQRMVAVAALALITAGAVAVDGRVVLLLPVGVAAFMLARQSSRFPATGELVRAAWLRGLAWTLAGIVLAQAAGATSPGPRALMLALLYLLALPVTLALLEGAFVLRALALVGTVAVLAVGCAVAALALFAGAALAGSSSPVGHAVGTVLAPVVDASGVGLTWLGDQVGALLDRLPGFAPRDIEPRLPSGATTSGEGPHVTTFHKVVAAILVVAAIAIVVRLLHWWLRRTRRPRQPPEAALELPRVRDRRQRLTGPAARRRLWPRLPRRGASAIGPHAARVRRAFQRVLGELRPRAPLPAQTTAADIATRCADAAPAGALAAFRLADAYRAARYGAIDVSREVAAAAEADAAAVVAALRSRP
jgi:hypothetical protein